MSKIYVPATAADAQTIALAHELSKAYTASKLLAFVNELKSAILNDQKEFDWDEEKILPAVSRMLYVSYSLGFIDAAEKSLPALPIPPVQKSRILLS